MPKKIESGDTEKFDHSDHPTSHATADDMRGQGTGKANVSPSDKPGDADAGRTKGPATAKR